MTSFTYSPDPNLDQLILSALAEDIGPGDVTTASIVSPMSRATATLIAKSSMVLCGMSVAERVFKLLDSTVEFQAHTKDGRTAHTGKPLASLSGRAASLLMAERTALNLLQHMSGVATLTQFYSHAVSHTKAKIAATRKTLPGLRALDKRAVQVGGGIPHRSGLYDGILIKENHIAVAGGIEPAVLLARANCPHLLKIEVEVSNLLQVEEACGAGADVVMLDNMPVELMREAVRLIDGRAIVEASGGISTETVKAVAETGVDIISVGALTHSAPAADISMLIDIGSGA